MTTHDKSVDWQTRVAALEMDLRERDREIRRLRQEYGLQRQQAERQRTTAAAGSLEALARELASPLSQLATMQSLAEKGRELRAGDVLKLFGKVEQALNAVGLTRIGAVGAAARFESRLHRTMGGGDPSEGELVTVRFVGYQLGETILLKAMVSRKSDPTGSGGRP